MQESPEHLPCIILSPIHFHENNETDVQLLCFGLVLTFRLSERFSFQLRVHATVEMLVDQCSV